MTVKLKRHYLNTWLSAKKENYLAEGDFYQMTGLYPTLDRRELIRAPDFSAHKPHSGLTDVEGMFYDAVNDRYVLIGQDGSSQLACTYFSAAWSAWGSSQVLDAGVATLDGYSMRNFFFSHGYLYFLSDADHMRTDNYATTAGTDWHGLDAELTCTLGGRIYSVQDDGKFLRQTTAGGAMETHYDTPCGFDRHIWCGGLKDDLLIVSAMDDGSLRVFRIPAYALTSVRKLDDMAVLYCGSTDYPSVGNPFCIHDNDLYMLSGDLDNPDGTATRDLLVYTGYRIERVARISDGTASPSSVGLLTWRGELIYYEFTSTTATFKMLVGNDFIDFAEPSSYTAAPNPLAASLNGNIVFTGEESSTEGVYYLGENALQDGNVETSWLDGGLPGVKKRLINLSMHIKDGTSTTVKTLSYKLDDDSAYTQAATETDATEKLEATSLGLEFYRLRIKAAIAETSTTADVRLRGISYTYAVGEE